MKRKLLFATILSTLFTFSFAGLKPSPTAQVVTPASTPHTSPVAVEENALVTPLDQSENETDRTITQKIRRSLVEDNILSTNAKNVKIITIDGLVTLRGCVDNKHEKRIIVSKAKLIAGEKHVDNYIETSIR